MSANKNGLGDDQGTRVGTPDKQATPANHSDTETGRPDPTTGMGREATEPSEKGAEHEHRTRYGGDAGTPKPPAR
jgi:hypothetical protein